LLRDSQNNVGVLVDSFGSVAVVKYAVSGAPLWTNRYDTALYDAPMAFAVDSADSFYVTIVSAQNSNPGSLALAKYSSNGALLWTRAGDITDALPKSPSISVSPGITTDSDNNAFVAVVTTRGYSIIKYTAEGSPLWTNNYSIPSGTFPSTKFFGVDGNNNAMLVSGLSRLGNDRVLMLKLSPSGELSVNSHDWPASNDFLTSATLDAAGNVYLAGSMIPSGSYRYHIFTAKYDTTGTLAWSRLRPPANAYNAVSRQIALDFAGNVIATAYERSPISEDEDETQTLTLKYSPTGDALWSARALGFDRSPTGLATDGGGNIYVVSGGSSGGGVFFTMYRPNGSQAGEAAFPGYSPGHIVTGASGEFYAHLGGSVETRKFADVESGSPLSATIAPSFVEALPGSSVTFTAVVSGVGPFTYDWRYFGYRLGATNATLTLTNVQYQWRSHGDYTVIVSNGTDSAISPEARLSVLRVPVVQIAPAIQYVRTGEAASLTAVAQGTEPFTFTWFRNGQLIPGATQATLSYPSAAAGQAGYYTVVVSNRAGTVTSAPATLHVILPPLSFANATPIAMGTNGTAIPYPSDITVSGITNVPLKMTATLTGLTSDQPYDLVVVLQAPSGVALVLMSEVADDTSANGVTLTFDDEALQYVPDEQLASGSFKPGWPEPVLLPPPAPVSPWVSTLAELLSHQMNGTWRLFVSHRPEPEFINQSPALISGGWSLSFLSSEPNAIIQASIRSITRAGDQVVVEWQGAPAWKLQQSHSLGSAQWTDVPGSLGASQVQFPLGTSNQFFRLVRE
jgi:hypothetical protein